MKKLLSIIALSMGVLMCTAQFTITTTKLGICDWNEFTGAFDKDCGFFYEDSSILEFKLKESMFLHTANDRTSTYYVDWTDHDKDIERGLFIYHVTSNNDNKYIFLIDMKYSQVRCMPKNGDYLITTELKELRYTEN